MLVISCVLLLFQLVPSQTSTNVRVTNVRVTLDVFSGRPNPAWVLDESEAHTLLEKLKNLPPARNAFFSDKLGYRGFILEVSDSESKETTQIRLYKGNVTYGEGREAKFYKDNESAIERFLLSLAGARIDVEMQEYIETELRKFRTCRRKLERRRSRC